MPTITIRIHGLCMFVPGNEGHMYILMPETGLAGGESTVPQHDVLLGYYPDQVDSGEAGPVIEFPGVELSFRGVASAGADPTFRRGVVDVSGFTGVGVPSGNKDGNPHGKLAARVVLPSGRMEEAVDRLACWKMRRAADNKKFRVEMTDWVTWKIPTTLPGESFAVYNRPLTGGSYRHLVTFRHDLDNIDLFIVHHHPGDTTSPSEPAEDWRPPHFAAYYSLSRGGNREWPKYKRGGCPGGGPEPEAATARRQAQSGDKADAVAYDVMAETGAHDTVAHDPTTDAAAQDADDTMGGDSSNDDTGSHSEFIHKLLGHAGPRSATLYSCMVSGSTFG